MKILGSIYLKGDKSIAHRAIMLASICNGNSIIKNIPQSKDILSTINALRSCGIKINNKNEQILVSGNTFRVPNTEIECGNSGTTMRLMVGLLAHKKIRCKLIGDSSLSSRPMDRIINPLFKLGIHIKSHGIYPPLEIHNFGIQLADRITISVPSAQVKSSLIFSCLGCDIKTRISEKAPTRDHLELMINSINSEALDYQNNEITVHPTNKKNWKGFEIILPGDISSASYFIAAATLLPGSKLVINDVLLNKRRMGFIDSLINMGGDIIISNEEYRHNERIGNITIKGVQQLRALDIPSYEIPGMIDEIPILALMCSYANGISNIFGLGELRHKESDRLSGIVSILNSMGVEISECGDRISIKGNNKLYNTNKLNNYNDHRLAMMISIAQLVSGNDIEYPECINISFPDFKKLLNKVINYQ